MELITGMCLLIQSVWDIRTKEISLGVTLGLGIFSFIYSIYFQREWTSFCFALLPGVLCLFLGFCTKQAIGYGDGILFCSMGMLYSLEQMIGMFMVAVFLAGTMSLILVVFFQKKKNYEIPFVPFMFLGWLLYRGIPLLEGAL